MKWIVSVTREWLYRWHGYEDYDETITYTCNKCGYKTDDQAKEFNYCPVCGRKASAYKNYTFDIGDSNRSNKLLLEESVKA